MRQSRSPLTWLALLPPLAVAWLIASQAVNLPDTDEWQLVPFVLKADEGRVSFADVWAQHNEHRIASVRMIIMLLLPVTRFNVVTQMFVAFGLALAAFVLLWLAVARSLGREHASMQPLVVLPAALLMFSAVQYETWLHSLPALQWQLSGFCAAAVVWSLAEWPGSPRVLGLAGICAVVAMLALASGMLLWPAAVCGVLCFPREVRRWGSGTVLAAGALGGVALAAAYFAGFDANGPASVTSALQDPGGLAGFTAVYLASPFMLGLGVRIAGLVGSAGVLLSIVLVYLAIESPRVRATAAPWIALWVYSFGAAGATAVGRLGLGLEEALLSRYAATAALFWVATIAVGVLVWTGRERQSAPARGRPAAAAAGLAAVACVGLYVNANRQALNELAVRQRNLREARTEVMLYETAPHAVFQFLFPPDPELVRRGAAGLEQAALGPFSSRPGGRR